MYLQDKVLVVSGVGPDLGRQIAVRGAAAGADVVLAARTASRLEDVAAEIKELGRRALVVPTDMTVEADAERLAAASVDEFGRVDALVHNALVMPPIADLGTVDLDAGAGRLQQQRDLGAADDAAVHPGARGDGRLGRDGQLDGRPVLPARPWARTRWPRHRCSRWRRAWPPSSARRGIRVNSVAPGHIWGESLKWYFGYLAKKRGVDADQIYAETAASIDLGRLPEPDEIADAVLFLASPLARAITGQCLDVNCGEYHH